MQGKLAVSELYVDQDELDLRRRGGFDRDQRSSQISAASPVVIRSRLTGASPSIT